MSKDNYVVPKSKSEVIKASREAGRRVKERERIANLISPSFRPYEGIVEEKFKVIGVDSMTYYTRHITKWRAGECDTNDVSHQGLVLKVLPTNESLEVEELNFEGNSGVRCGDDISAKLPKYKLNDNNSEEYGYAVKLKILGDGGKVLRTDEAHNYNHFVDS